MVDNARDLTERLRPMPGLKVGFDEFLQESHLSALPLVAQGGVGFILRD